ncbi:V-type proton ATPase subunit G 1 [Manacus vitellinus]|uniref:V-type proton ATPase subunit G 1 n=1 Tax=Manacus vitellinus TaxID=328815 RepID=UPI00115F0E2F|nr:V-type proton ATPase subunit G 1 [Manacus vitellinus]
MGEKGQRQGGHASSAPEKLSLLRGGSSWPWFGGVTLVPLRSLREAWLVPPTQGAAAVANSVVIAVHWGAAELWATSSECFLFCLSLVLFSGAGKNRRLKQAKEEAQAEIEQYRLQREKEFKAKEAAALGSHGSCTTEVEKETQEKMSVIQQNFQKNREVVLSQLLSLVCDIKPEIHVNYRING